MKPFVLIAAAVLAMPLCLTANAAPEGAANENLVTVRSVDFSGKPPFKRRTERLPAHDVAALEMTEATQVTVRNTDFRGRPPFRRNVEHLTLVVETASLEIGEPVESKAARFRGRPPFKH